jgi:OOP family OmpA-OmpF porin
MKSRLSVMALAAMAIAVLAGCVTSGPKLAFEPGTIDRGYWVPKADRFEVIVDASRSMADPVGRQRKVEVAQAAADSMARTIPEFSYAGGLRTFGQGKCLPKEKTSLLTGMGAYSTAGFTDAVARITCARGRSPLDMAMTASGTDLTGAAERAAMIVVTDGLHMGKDEVAAAQALKATYGDTLCIYAVQVGNDPLGRKLLQQVVDAAGCGKVVAADELTTGDAMAGFVQEALLERDSDGDGVGDSKDKCPGTPKGVKVDAVGCPIDTDGDGVPDYLDKCPDTPKGLPVDEAGCPPKLGTIYFNVDDWSLDQEDRKTLAGVVEMLTKYPAAKFTVQGHTDSTGPRRWNDTLSLRRAKSVVNYLLGKEVAADRLTPKGYGPDQPAVPNDTRANRAKNRRAEIAP